TDGLSIMVRTMEANPNAAFGLSVDNLSDKIIRNKLYDPASALISYFEGYGIFNCGPSGSIISKEIFDAAGGFPETRFTGDICFWLKISSKYPVIVLQPGLIFWRTHEEQEYLLGTSGGQYPVYRFNSSMTVLFYYSSSLPLSKKVRFILLQTKLLLINFRRSYKKRGVKKSFELFKDISFKKIF
ncbi:MAG: hypothetical protein ABUL44_03370, partial [Flavobacterium sp.]